MNFYKSKRVLVTGGASFIGSHLVDLLVSQGAQVTVADDLSSGKLSNLEYPLERRSANEWASEELVLLLGDLKDRSFVRKAATEQNVVFHLAAIHGGRGFIDTHPAECSTNMAIDQLVFEEAFKTGVERICYASSACVYPTYLQTELGSSYLLREEDADPFVRDKALADREYGWAKLMGEMTLRAYHSQYGLKASSVRIFTAYGPRENETHAIIALIAKAFVKMEPYVIWGTGNQERNFTYVQDVVDALSLASQKIEDATAVNAGRDDRITLAQAADLIFNLVAWKPGKVVNDLTMPQGVSTRAADLTKARALLGWEPRISYEKGFRRTIDRYQATKNAKEVAMNLGRIVLEREA